MIGTLRILALVVATAFWAQPPLQTSTRPGGSDNTAPAAASNQTTGKSGAPNAVTMPPASNPAAQYTAENPAPAPLEGPVQPVPFSHKQHAGTLQLPCEFCHAPSRTGETVKIPQAAMCMQCHETMATSNPGVQKLASYAKDNRTIPWVRVYELPSFVSFSHKRHLKAGATCQQCHGPVAERVQLYQESDISMTGCMNCHRAKNASIGCNTCHMIDQ
ncbi:MAG TPA: cytochrome c3 family protein [Acidobacteriaceae bacterium]|nr:cytochrome c3 family protein [Acidobacteriaceae bacterium]